MLVAHRGLRIERDFGGYYENLASNFSAAYSEGFECCECDVQETKEGGLVVVHDYTLKNHALPYDPSFVKMSGEPLAEDEYNRIVDTEIKDLTLAEIQSIPMRRSEDGSFEYVPTLEAVLAAIPADRQMLLELKSASFSEEGMKKVAELTTAKKENIVFISFYLANLQHVHALCPEFSKILLTVSQGCGGYDDVLIDSLEGLKKQAAELRVLFDSCPFGFGLEVSASPVDAGWFGELEKLGLISQAWYDDKGERSSLEESQAFHADLFGVAKYFNVDYAVGALNVRSRNAPRK